MYADGTVVYSLDSDVYIRYIYIVGNQVQFSLNQSIKWFWINQYNGLEKIN